MKNKKVGKIVLQGSARNAISWWTFRHGGIIEGRCSMSPKTQQVATYNYSLLPPHLPLNLPYFTLFSPSFSVVCHLPSRCHTYFIPLPLIIFFSFLNILFSNFIRFFFILLIFNCNIIDFFFIHLNILELRKC